MSNKHTININGSPRSARLTFYEWQGRTVIRTSKSLQPRRQTRAQFKVRMRFLHTRTLWSALWEGQEAHAYGFVVNAAGKASETIYIGHATIG